MTRLTERQAERLADDAAGRVPASRLGPPDGVFLPGPARWLMRAGLGMMLSIHVHGIDQVPRTGPLIIVANHISLADPPLLIATMPRPITLMAKEELLAVPLFGGILRLGGAFPVRRGEADRLSLRTALTLLERELAVVLFPEGTRSRTLQLQAGHKGVAFLAHRSGAPILPVGITGTEAFRRPSRLFTRPRVDVRIGPPFDLASFKGEGNRLAAATEEIMRRIAALLPAERRGGYAYVE